MTHTEFQARTRENPNLIVTDPAAQDAALKQARGCYQEDLLIGRETLSGAGLRGKASEYGARYAQSRAALLGRLTEAGIEWSEVRGVRGKRILVLGPVPVEAAA